VSNSGLKTFDPLDNVDFEYNVVFQSWPVRMKKLLRPGANSLRIFASIRKRGDRSRRSLRNVRKATSLSSETF